MRWKRLQVLSLILLLMGGVRLFALEHARPSLDQTQTVVPRPSLNYTSDSFQTVSLLRDAWNESYEVPLNTTNHYWYGSGSTEVVQPKYRNATLDSSFEEVSSSSLNPNVNLPGWVLDRNDVDLDVTARRNVTVSYDGKTWENVTNNRNGGFEEGLLYWTNYQNGSWNTVSRTASTQWVTEGSYSLRLYGSPNTQSQSSPWVQNMGVYQGNSSFQNQVDTSVNTYIHGDVLRGSTGGLTRISAGWLSIGVKLTNASLTPTDRWVYYDLFFYVQSGTPSSYVQNTTNELHFIIRSSMSGNTWYSVDRNLKDDYEGVYPSAFSQRKVTETRVLLNLRARYSNGAWRLNSDTNVEAFFDQVLLTNWNEVGHSAYVETKYKDTVNTGDHVSGGLTVPEDYLMYDPKTWLADNATIEASFLIDAAGAGGGSCTAYYLLLQVSFLNSSASPIELIYAFPITVIGSPAGTHFLNTTTERYIYGRVSINQTDKWFHFSENLKATYEKVWGQPGNTTVVGVKVLNDLYQPLAGGPAATPFIQANYDGLHMTLEKQGNEEQIPNGNFETEGWTKTVKTFIKTFTYSKTSADSVKGTTSYQTNATGAAQDEKEYAAVGISGLSFIRDAAKGNTLRVSGQIKVVSMSELDDRTFVAVRLRLTETSLPYTNRYVWYAVCVQGGVPGNDQYNRYYRLVRDSDLQRGVWYAFSRDPVADASPSWPTWNVTGIDLITYFERPKSYEPNVVARFDDIKLEKLVPGGTVFLGDVERSTSYALDGNYSMRLNVALQQEMYAKYECGAENGNNSYYVAFPKNLNLSVNHIAASGTGQSIIQISLALDSGPNYGAGYGYELIYYYGDPSYVKPIFAATTQSINITSTIITGSWINLNRNWTADIPGSWTLDNPRVEAIAMRAYSISATPLDVYWDLTSFRGYWQGVKKIVQLQLRGEVQTRQLNITDKWTMEGNQSSYYQQDFVDSNTSDVDSSSSKGTHSNFPAQRAGPDSIYDTLTETEGDGGNWGITSSGFTASSTHTNYRYMGGMSPNIEGMTITHLWIRMSGAGTVAIGIWTGGTLDDPTGAIKRTEAYNVPVSSGWNRIDVPDYSLPANTVTWIGWAHSASVYYSSSSSDSGDFQSGQGRWSQNSPSNADETSSMPNSPTTGSFSNNWFAVYAEYTLPPSQLDLEIQWTNTDYNGMNETLAIYAAKGNNTRSLDATGGYMIIGDGTPDWGSVTGTISFWIEWDTVGNRPWGQHDNMELRFSGSNLVVNWGGTGSITSSTSFTAGRWYFIAVVWDEITNDLYLYVGDQDNAPTEDTHIIGWASTVSTVGVTENNFMASRGGVNPTDGRGDDLRYWNTDRTLTEIQGDYKIELIGSETNLRSYFKLNSNFDDIGTNNNDGSVSGSYSFSTDVPFDPPTTENVRVDVWTGSGWQNLFTDLMSGWNNVSVSSYWTSSTFTIRFKGGTETSDTVQDKWQIDAALLRSGVTHVSRANSTSANQWYYKWWGFRKIYVENGTGTYEITANASSQGIFSYYDNEWNLEDDTVISDWSGYVKYNVTNFELTAYTKNLEYLDYVLVEYIIVFCGPSGTFKFDNLSTATAANDPDEYGGLTYWLLNKQGNTYLNYISSNSSLETVF